jgi:hypothetical protein
MLSQSAAVAHCIWRSSEVPQALFDQWSPLKNIDEDLVVFSIEGTFTWRKRAGWPLEVLTDIISTVPLVHRQDSIGEYSLPRMQVADILEPSISVYPIHCWASHQSFQDTFSRLQARTRACCKMPLNPSLWRSPRQCSAPEERHDQLIMTAISRLSCETWVDSLVFDSEISSVGKVRRKDNGSRLRYPASLIPSGRADRSLPANRG